MKLEDFKSGSYKQQFKYKSFSPNHINHVWTWEDPSLNTLLEKATKALSSLDAFSYIVPDIDLFIEMHINKEANESSRIEDTKTNMDELLLSKEEVFPEKRNDWQEVQNYIKATNFSIKELQELPLSARWLRNTHKILMTGVRGEHKTPGEFRVSQNWIGSGTSIEGALFIPPHHTEIPDLIGDLENFLNNEDIHVPHLVRIAISHYQFETIHPFLDGNGRIGRLLITLYLIRNGMLSKPSLYLSDYFEKNKGDYYDALTTVRASNNIIHWIKFFLVAIIETSEKGYRTFQEILRIKKDVDKKVLTLGNRADKGSKLLIELYKKPNISSGAVCEALDITPITANKLLSDFENLGIVNETTGYKRNKKYVFEEYLNLFR